MLRDFRFYASIGIIDFFELTLNKEELAIRLSNNLFDAPSFDNEGIVIEDSYSKAKMEEINEIETKVKDIIFNIEKEYPHTIRYFPIPNPDYCDFDVCAVAKISNNGSTYIFSPNKEYVETMSYDYGPVKEIE